jgi:histone H3/H4
MNNVVLPTTMSRLLKVYTGLHRIEKAAAILCSNAADQWIHSAVENIKQAATVQEEKTISERTVAFVVESEDIVARNWSFCKTRLRDRVKELSPGFRWSLAGKIVLYNAFDDYLKLLAGRIASTQELAKRKTISAKHVTAAVISR